MRNVFLHEVSIIKDVSHIVFVILISLKACTCSGSCVFCHGHLKAVCRFWMFSVCTPLPTDTGRDPLELCQRHSRLCYVYWKLPCCCTLWFKATGRLRFFFFFASAQQSQRFFLRNLFTFSLANRMHYCKISYLFKLYKMHFLSSHWGPLRKI